MIWYFEQNQVGVTDQCECLKSVSFGGTAKSSDLAGV